MLCLILVPDMESNNVMLQQITLPGSCNGASGEIGVLKVGYGVSPIAIWTKGDGNVVFIVQ